jgi:hypothetical protein
MARALADSFYKKLCPKGNTAEADLAALKKFEAINARISAEPFEFAAHNEAESCFWDYFRNNLNRTLGFDVGDTNYDLDFIREHMNVGPGAAQKADADTMVSKLFASPISYTNEYLIPYYRSALSQTGLWADAERQRFSRFPFIRVEGGKLFFAPKNADISRTCCTEANLNMLVQMSLGAFMEYRMGKHFGINLSDQPDNNRELARIGSIDGSFGTIDLVSASDSISWQLVLRALEDGFVKSMLRMSRSETAVLPDGRKVVLNMISTMGNGFTFPLQTIIFACTVRSVYQLMGFPSACPRTQFGVFGDDIIVRREAYDFVVRMLNKLGFEVNAGKSFNSGPFRESCGHDCFRGHNIRGVYIKSLETPQQIYSCINRLVRWSAVSGIPLVRTLNLLRSWISHKEIRVPRSEADDSGLKVPFRFTRPQVTNNYWYSYRYYKKLSRKQIMPEADDYENPSGLGVGYLSGHIRRRELPITDKRSSLISLWDTGDYQAEVALRDPPGGSKRYKIAYGSIPFWDWPGHAETRVQANLWRDFSMRDPREGINHALWEQGVVANFRF